MLFLSVRGFSDYAGPTATRADVAAVLPSSISERSRHPDPSAFRSSIARPTGTSGLRFRGQLTLSPARLEARMESLFSFPVGLLHPLQHAGLSRRTPDCRPSTSHLSCHEPKCGVRRLYGSPCHAAKCPRPKPGMGEWRKGQICNCPLTNRRFSATITTVSRIWLMVTNE